MAPAKKEGLDSLFRSCAAPWLGLWRCAAIMGRANLESIALFWNLRPRTDSLAALGQMMEHCMRSPGFLNLMQCSLKVMSTPPYFGFPQPPQPRSNAQ